MVRMKTILNYTNYTCESSEMQSFLQVLYHFKKKCQNHADQKLVRTQKKVKLFNTDTQILR